MQAELDVLIVGAGPVGLFLGRELMRHGLQVRIVEAHAGQSEHSKALAIMPRTLEVFEMAGIVEPFLEAANRVTQASVRSHGRELGSIALASPDTRYAYVSMIPQDQTEALLHDALVAVGGSVEYGTKLTGLQPDAQSVQVRLEHDGQLSETRARFVVGCDGAHSTVRHLLGLPFTGAPYPEQFVLADIHAEQALPPDQMQICPSERGALASFPMRDGRFRIVAMVDPDYAGEPDLPFVNRLLVERGLGMLQASRIEWATRFRIHHRNSPDMRVGRVFLAGDAAHIHSPFGAQGMNTGLQDAWNLGWKLRFALAGWADDALLESYGLERHRVARAVVRGTDLLTRVMATDQRALGRARNAAIRVLTRLPAFQSAFVSRVTELGVRYARSPIVLGSGERVSDEPIADPRTCLYRVLGEGYVLVLARGAAEASFMQLTAKYPRSLTIVHSADERAATRLVRPDGYLAYRARPKTSPRRAAAAIDTLLARQLLAQAA